MNEIRDSQPDDRLARLLATTNSDAAPPDATALAVIRERSTAEFTAAGAEPVLMHQQRSTQFVIRALTTLAATSAIVMAGYFLSGLIPRDAPPVAELPLGTVLQKLAGLHSFEAELVEGQKRYHVWSKNNDLRIEESPARYTIARNREIWSVDEEDNQARPLQGIDPQFFFRDGDSLRLMGLSPDEVGHVLPTKKVVESGRELLVYYCSTLSKPGTLEVTVLVDPTTQLPKRLLVDHDDGRQRMPMARIAMVAADSRVDDTKFQVPATLTADGRIGKITDHQGLVSLRPLTSARWTPVCGETILRLGDWLRTDFQGANAVTVNLAPQAKVILGPGSLAEFKKPDQIVLHSGIAEITPSPKSDGFSGVVKLMGPAGQAIEVGSLLLVRADEQGLTRLMKDPPWLAGYKSAGVQESLGSLVAKIDGREVPLTVGYHKVAVEIRDQIARTTIEESFANHTDQQLEGQFHFPLPADASISGFGMWIGDKLVEADIVEKQRAREIYETILREKRDPGLLEWTGGNIFKARVYPIFAKSEKRIKIVYTQVLPRKEASYRYSYPLQSELLRQNPLRQLDLEVTIASTQPLVSVESPTHLTRNQLTPHAARVEFSAQNYSPSRDFEVVATVDGKSPEVTFIPHQRGGDGYFLLMLQPPSEAGAWQRDVLPTGEPLNLIVLADTSASLDKASRRNQAEVIAALLGSLSPQDRFQLAGCDVDCVWATAGPQAAEEKKIAAARAFLAKRRSLGWTDLDKAFGEVLKRATPGTHVIYAGDGVVTNVGADGVRFTNRVAQAAAGKGATCHAIAVSSSFDQMVLRGIASIGGGSLRMISGENGPQPTARDLLAEITRPALKNIQVEFKGLRTARVYPRTLPNIPTGTQQILLGRYLPDGKEQRGEVVVTGTLGGKPVTYRTGFRVQGSEFRPEPTVVSSSRPSSIEDASFVPRLWSRLHLDELLAQGGSQQIQDEIIALSEEFHIITPYTSLLVLESDADRERFKVKKRFQIRDGERFFAAGRDDAQYDLVQQQIRAAGLWRAGLRQRVLSQLAGLGRDAQVIPSSRYTTDDVHNSNLSWMHSPSNEFTAGMNSRGSLGDFDDLIRLIKTTVAPQSWDTVAGPGAIDSFQGNLSLIVSQSQDVAWDVPDLQNLYLDTRGYFGRRLGEPDPRGLEPGFLVSNPFSYSMSGAVDGTTVNLPSFAFDSTPRMNIQEEDREALGIEMLGEVGFEVAKRESIWDVDDDGGRLNINEIDEFRSGGRSYKRLAAVLIDDLDVFRNPEGSLFAERHRYKSIDLGKSYWSPGETMASSKRRSGLLPISLGPAPRPAAAAQNASPRKATWAANVMQIVDALKSGVELANLAGGMAVEEQVAHYEPHRGRLTDRARVEALFSAGQWVIEQESDNGQSIIAFCDSAERGIASLPYELKLVRKSEPTDLFKTYKPGDGWRELKERPDSTVEMEQAADGSVLLVIRPILHTQDEERVLVAVAKHAVLSIERRHFGQPRSREEAKDFVEVGGVWLPQRLERYNDEGQLEQVITRKYNLLAADSFAARATDRRANTNDFLTLKLPFASLDDAKAAAAAGRATLEDRLVLLQEFANRQQWPEAAAELEKCEKFTAGKKFDVWMRLWLLEKSRRNEELRQLVLREAAKLAQQPRVGEWTLVGRLNEAAAAALESSEQLAVLEALQPVYARRPERSRGLVEWLSWKAARLYAAGRTDEQLALLHEAASRYPDERDFQLNYAQRLRDGGDYAAAYSWFKAALAHPQANWPPRDRDAIYSAYAEMLRDQGRFADIVDLVAGWTAQQPENTEVYALQYAALVYCGRYDEGDRLLAGWFADGLASQPLAKAATARLSAAIQTARGGNSRLGNGESQPQWYDELAAVLLAHFDRDESQGTISEIQSDWHFRESEPYRAASRQIVSRLKEQVATLPVGTLSRLIDWAATASASGYGASDDEWKAIATALRQRWDAATHPLIEETLTRALLTAYGRIGQDERLAFLRLRLEKSDDESRSSRARELFDALLEQSWTTESEGESLALIDKPTKAADPARGLREQITALYRWTDRMEQARVQKYESEIQRPDKLTRKELTEKRIANQKAARSGLSERLSAAAKDHSDGFARWLAIERLHLEVELGHELPKVADTCFELLGSQPPEAKAADAEWALADWLDLQFRARLVTMLTYLAANKETQTIVSGRLTRYLDAMIAQDPDGARLGLDGRVAKYRLLVGLDQPPELTESLSAWARQVKYPQRWQRTLAYLHAELGQLDQAVLLADALAKNDALTAPDYRQLALWHQALGHKQQHEQSLIAAYKQLDEYSLQRLIEQHLRPWQNTQGPTPGTIDPQVFLIQQALFEKASRPQDYVWQMRSFYEASRDFRCLAALADGVVGQSALNVYPFLEQLRTTLDTIDREATADELVQHMAIVRERAKTPIDLRALDLLEMLIERRAAEVLNQPGPHVARAIAALQRAEKRDWSPGEPRLMAEMLAYLRGISQPALTDEVLRVLTGLYAAANAGSLERLQIAQSLAAAQINNNRREQAISTLETAIAEYRHVVNDKTTADVVEAFDMLARFYGDVGQFVRAEAVLKTELPGAANRNVADELVWRIYAVHIRALASGGATSLGSGHALYRAVATEFRRAAAETPDQRQRKRLIDKLCELYRTAHDLKLPAVEIDVRTFANVLVPQLLASQVNEYQEIVSNVSGTLRTVAGPRDALAFLIARIEAEPRWLAMQGESGWRKFGYTLGDWREEVRTLDALEARLFAIVVAELRRELATQQSRHRVMYRRDHSHFWKEKRDDFARVAEEVLKTQPESQPGLLFISEYLFDGLDLRDRAIEVLLDAHRRQTLDDDGKLRLVHYLHQTSRYGESVPILEGLIERHPEQLGNRTRLMYAYHQTKRPEALVALLTATDKFFHEESRWNEQIAGQLADGCRDCELFEPAVDYYQEAIARRRESLGGHLAGDQRLAQYHAEQAYSYAGLRNTKAAVDAACEAIVVTGTPANGVSTRQRGSISPIEVLRDVLRQSPQLDAYVVDLDRETAQSHEDRAVVRKAIGEILFERMAYDKAVTQLKLAAELMPADAAIYSKLVACYDGLADRPAAVEQLIASLEVTRRDVELWAGLAQRLEVLGQTAEAERARTSLVEVLPHETEGHARLARIRQEQDRWDDAILHWREVTQLRKLEPAGLLSLANAQLHQQQWTAADESLKQLEKTDWPARYHDELRQKLPQLRDQWRKM